MVFLPIKPLSVNGSYRGRKYSTLELKKYKKDLSMILPHLKIPEGKLSVKYIFGISKQSDADNCIKAFQDSLAENYGFNDKDIYEWHVIKEIAKRGNEFIEFEISTYQP